jgi:hypothetical protein
MGNTWYKNERINVSIADLTLIPESNFIIPSRSRIKNGNHVNQSFIF